MREQTVAERYALALYEIAAESQSLEQLGEELLRVAGLFESSEELRILCAHPRFDQAARKRVLNELLERLALGPSVKHFTLLLSDRGRLSAIPAIQRAYQGFIDRALGRARGVVTSAAPLNDEIRAELKSALDSLSERDVVLEERVDEALIGGLVVDLGGRVYDGSVRTRLEGIAQTLLA
ncbi:MAG: ATP synthase F1 subunit delta [Myxococcota bacterium]|nr:ATP synthase F1 subunit delta [Myxococcota bacterium]